MNVPTPPGIDVRSTLSVDLTSMPGGVIFFSFFLRWPLLVLNYVVAHAGISLKTSHIQAAT